MRVNDLGYYPTIFCHQCNVNAPHTTFRKHIFDSLLISQGWNCGREITHHLVSWAFCFLRARLVYKIIMENRNNLSILKVLIKIFYDYNKVTFSITDVYLFACWPFLRWFKKGNPGDKNLKPLQCILVIRGHSGPWDSLQLGNVFLIMISHLTHVLILTHPYLLIYLHTVS